MHNQTKPIQSKANASTPTHYFSIKFMSALQRTLANDIRRWWEQWA